MTSRDFAYWLQGFFEVSEVTDLDEKQTAIIKNHLALVFKHEIDPSFNETPEQAQVMNDIHSGVSTHLAFQSGNGPKMRC